MNLLPEAIVFRDDLQRVFDSFREITLCAGVEQFTKWLDKNKGCQIQFITIYKYITESTPPAWLFPLFCEFLTQEPYINYQHVWEFVIRWGSPVQGSLERIKVKAFKVQAETMAKAAKTKARAEEFTKFL